MLALIRWLQLYMLADPAAAQPDVAVDLEGVFNGAFTKAKPAAGGLSVMPCCSFDTDQVSACKWSCSAVFSELVSCPLSGLESAIELNMWSCLSVLKYLLYKGLA